LLSFNKLFNYTIDYSIFAHKLLRNRMKKILAGLFIVSIILVSCVKQSSGTCNDILPASEESTILAFCKTDTITATKDSSGLYYQIITPGTGTTPTITSKITVTYTGYLLNGTVFDQENTTPQTFPLAGVIPGWQLGIPYIKSGGHIKLVIPSAYAYGCVGAAPTIPPNSILYFDIQLVSVQ
jgi:FKBP-type peptidyl-prolyl cis-trans isomerase FkpA